MPTRAADHDFQPEATVTPVGIFLPTSDELFLYGVTSKVGSRLSRRSVGGLVGDGDQLLQSADRRARELVTGSGYQMGREARIEELRKSPLGQHLANLANYCEGYTVAGDIRGSAQYVSRFFHGEPFHRTSYRLPEKFHETDLGKLVNEAMLRFYEEERPDQLLTMEDMRELFSVTRQTVHQWIKKGDIFPVYINKTTRFYRKDVDRLIEQQKKRKEKRGMPFTNMSCQFLPKGLPPGLSVKSAAHR